MGSHLSNIRNLSIQASHCSLARLACHGKTVAEAIRKTDGPRYRLADLRYDMKVGDAILVVPCGSR